MLVRLARKSMGCRVSTQIATVLQRIIVATKWAICFCVPPRWQMVASLAGGQRDVIASTIMSEFLFQLRICMFGGWSGIVQPRVAEKLSVDEVLEFSHLKSTRKYASMPRKREAQWMSGEWLSIFTCVGDTELIAPVWFQSGRAVMPKKAVPCQALVLYCAVVVINSIPGTAKGFQHQSLHAEMSIVVNDTFTCHL